MGGSRGLLPLTAAVSRRYFVVELLDPQLNFLDVKNHASLIVVSGRSSLEGQKDTSAILARTTHSQMAPHANPNSSNGQRISLTKPLPLSYTHIHSSFMHPLNILPLTHFHLLQTDKG